MKTHTVKTYNVRELKEQFPEAFERTLKKYQREQEEIFWQDETIESLKELYKRAGVELRDWSLVLLPDIQPMKTICRNCKMTSGQE